MGKPLNMNPEEYVADIIKQQQERIAELEAGQGVGQPQPQPMLEYSYSASLLEPPSSGQLRSDAATNLETTKIWPHKLTNDGIDSTNYFMGFRAGDKVYMQDKNDAIVYGRYTLSADPIDKSGYFELLVTVVEAAGSLNGGQLGIITLSKA